MYMYVNVLYGNMSSVCGDVCMYRNPNCYLTSKLYPNIEHSTQYSGVHSLLTDVPDRCRVMMVVMMMMGLLKRIAKQPVGTPVLISSASSCVFRWLYWWVCVNQSEHSDKGCIECKFNTNNVKEDTNACLVLRA